jgi:DNA polymerase (family 10)/putative hydrolase
MSVKDYFDYASRCGVATLIFLEHIRREPSYDVYEFAAQIKESANAYKIEAVVGFEAKLLPDGSLDISDKHLALAKVIGLAEHRFPDDRRLLEAAFRKAVDSCRSLTADKVVVWVHPGLWFKRRGIALSKELGYLSMIEFAQSAGLLLERNLKHELIPKQMMQYVEPNQMVIGADVHNVEGFRVWQEQVRLGWPLCPSPAARERAKGLGSRSRASRGVALR